MMGPVALATAAPATAEGYYNGCEYILERLDYSYSNAGSAEFLLGSLPTTGVCHVWAGSTTVGLADECEVKIVKGVGEPPW